MKLSKRELKKLKVPVIQFVKGSKDIDRRTPNIHLDSEKQIL